MYGFYKNYISLNLKDYSGIGIDLEITKLLFAFFIGMIAATIVINYNRASTSLVIKKLLRHEALTEESAKTLSELSANLFGVKMLLKSNGRIKRIIKRVGQQEYTYEEYMSRKKKKDKGVDSNCFKEEKIDFISARFYISEDRITEANGIVDRSETSVINTVLFCILITAVFICLVFLMPEILNLINNALVNK